MISLSHSDSIKVLFNLQDLNLHFLEDDIQKIQKNILHQHDLTKPPKIQQLPFEPIFSTFQYQNSTTKAVFTLSNRQNPLVSTVL